MAWTVRDLWASCPSLRYRDGSRRIIFGGVFLAAQIGLAVVLLAGALGRVTIGLRRRASGEPPFPNDNESVRWWLLLAAALLAFDVAILFADGKWTWWVPIPVSVVLLLRSMWGFRAARATTDMI